MKTHKIILVGIAAGLFASWIKAIVEPPLQDIGLKYFPTSEDALEIKGADIQGHPENMPPSVLAKTVYQEITGHQLRNTEAVKTMPYIHYALGALIGISYVLARDKYKEVKVLQGIPAGAAAFALTHGSTVPALHLQGEVREMPKSWWVWEFGSHLVFGFCLEQSTKLFKRLI